MAEIFHLKRGDTSPALLYRLDPAVDLTGASIVFNMRARGGRPVLDRVPAVIDGAPADGVVRYDWGATEVADPGLFEAEFEVSYADGSIETFPNSDFIVISIAGDIA